MSTSIVSILFVSILSAIVTTNVQSASVSPSNYKKIFYDFEQPKELYLEQPSNYMSPQLSKFFYRRFLKSPQLKYAIANYKPDSEAKEEGIKPPDSGPKDKTLWRETEAEEDAKRDEGEDKKKSAASASVGKVIQFNVPTGSLRRHYILKSEPSLDWTRKQ